MAKKNPYQAHFINFRHILFDIARWSGWPFLVWFRMKKIYETKEQKRHVRGGALIVANHILYSDPMVLHTTFWYRRLHFVVMKELFDKPFNRWLYSNCGCIPVDREKFSLKSLREIVLRLQGGNVIGIFPEGHVTLKNSNPMQSFKSGAILMALQSDVPIIPTYREIRKSIWHRQKIVIGAPIYIKKIFGENMGMSQIEEATEYLYKKEQELKKLYHQGEKA